MPHSELHSKKKKKNLALLAAILGLCVLIWIITMIKLNAS